MLRLLLVLASVLILVILAMKIIPQSIQRSRRAAEAASGLGADGGVTITGSPATVRQEIRGVRTTVERTLERGQQARDRQLGETTGAER